MNALTKEQCRLEGKRSQITIQNMREPNKVLASIIAACIFTGEEEYDDNFFDYVEKQRAKLVKKFKNSESITYENCINHLVK